MDGKKNLPSGICNCSQGIWLFIIIFFFFFFLLSLQIPNADWWIHISAPMSCLHPEFSSGCTNEMFPEPSAVGWWTFFFLYFFRTRASVIRMALLVGLPDDLPLHFETASSLEMIRIPGVQCILTPHQRYLIHRSNDCGNLLNIDLGKFQTESTVMESCSRTAPKSPGKCS